MAERARPSLGRKARATDELDRFAYFVTLFRETLQPLQNGEVVIGIASVVVPVPSGATIPYRRSHAMSVFFGMPVKSDPVLMR